MLTRAIESLTRAGFAEHFGIAGDDLRSFTSGRRYRASEVVIREFHRFEGVSDPDDRLRDRSAGRRAGNPGGCLRGLLRSGGERVPREGADPRGPAVRRRTGRATLGIRPSRRDSRAEEDPGTGALRRLPPWCSDPGSLRSLARRGRGERAGAVIVRAFRV